MTSRCCHLLSGQTSPDATSQKTTTAREHGLQVESVSYTLPSGLKIIHDVSLDVKPGQLCAIMGPSGAGKTTALDLFAKRGLKGVIEGSVRWDGREDWSPVRKASYSEQTDECVFSSLLLARLLTYMQPARRTHGQRDLLLCRSALASSWLPSLRA